MKKVIAGRVRERAESELVFSSAETTYERIREESRQTGGKGKRKTLG